jgi:hypothetical protein
MQIILQTNHHKSQIVVYQLLSIWIKYLMFCKHVSIYFYTSQNNNNQTSISHELGFFFGGTHPKIKACACVKTSLHKWVRGSRREDPKEANWWDLTNNILISNIGISNSVFQINKVPPSSDRKFRWFAQTSGQIVTFSWQQFTWGWFERPQ